jgi:alpha-D-xyloside xylohydrolase
MRRLSKRFLLNLEGKVMSQYYFEENSLFRKSDGELLKIQPWGYHSLRVRATQNPSFSTHDWALISITEENYQNQVKIKIEDNVASIKNGKIEAQIFQDGSIKFSNTENGDILLSEIPHPFPDNTQLGGRQFRHVAGDLFQIEARFQAHTDEMFFGLGQHQHGLLDQKGCTLDLIQINTEINIPFMISSLGYGFLWNNPAIGRVELGNNRTRWVAQSSRQIDYWITAGDSPAEILHHYVDVTGHVPVLPEWAAGFWQSKLRYASQDELLSVANEYKQRRLPLSVIVVDGLHWTLMGDWKFDPTAWPDPSAMASELYSMGVRTMVSVWPTVNALSSNFVEMGQRNLLVRTKRGVAAHTTLVDSRPEPPVYLHLYDPSNPEAREFIWQQIFKGYFKHGIKIFWLDACEPEIYPVDHDNLQYFLGNGLEVSNLYPFLHQQAFYEGMKKEDETEIITLSRSAWAGSQRFAAAVWSGDIASTFDALRTQIPAGLNIGLSGIPWWATDIGGFHGGDPANPDFQELIVRWFQFGVFSPIFRLHGFRHPIQNWSGAANEVWSFGSQAYELIKKCLYLREKIRPYIMELMVEAHQTGAPPMRPLFFDFPNDKNCYQVADQYMFGSRILVAPVIQAYQRNRLVYLPEGVLWKDAWNGHQYRGGSWIDTPAPLDRIPVFVNSKDSFYNFDSI